MATLSTATGTGKSIYFLIFSGSQVLEISSGDPTTYVSADYADYVLHATEVGSSGVYQATFPATADAGDYDVFPYEAIDGTGNEAEGDPFAAGGFSIYFNGSSISTSPGANVDSDVALITLAEAKQYLKVTTTNDNLILATLINSVSSWILRYIDRNLVATDYVEYYSGDNSDELVLRNYPIVSVASIKLDSLRVFGSSSLIADTNYIVKKAQGIIKAFNLFGSWPCGESNIKVSYNAGYIAGETVPYDIKLAAFRLLDLHYRLGYSQRKLDTSSESMSQMTTTYKDEDIPKDVKLMLDAHKRYLPSPQFSYAD